MKVSELIEKLEEIEDQDQEVFLMVELEDEEEQDVLPLNSVQVMEDPKTGDEIIALVCDFGQNDEGEDEEDDEEDEDEEDDEEDEDDEDDEDED